MLQILSNNEEVDISTVGNAIKQNRLQNHRKTIKIEIKYHGTATHVFRMWLCNTLKIFLSCTTFLHYIYVLLDRPDKRVFIRFCVFFTYSPSPVFSKTIPIKSFVNSWTITHFPTSIVAATIVPHHLTLNY